MADTDILEREDTVASPGRQTDSQSSAKTTTAETVAQIVRRSDQVIDKLKHAKFEPEGHKLLERRYSITEVAKMTERTANGIRKAEQGGALPAPQMKGGRREGYTLEEVNRIRDYFGLHPGRQDREEPFRLSFQNFKGGVGKTTLSCHCAQYFAQKGYRVLMIDCDSQASATTTFGFRPDTDFDSDDTLLPFLSGDTDTLETIIRPTHWDRLDLIPANLELYSAEYYLAGIAGQSDIDWISLLDEGIKTVEHLYDVIIIDPPPALGMISLNVLRSLNGLIVPAPPAMYDFHSTATFFRMLDEVLEQVGKHLGKPFDLSFMKLLISKYDPSKGSQEFVAQLMKQHYSEHVLLSPMVQSAEIDNASGEWKTVYELQKGTSSRRTYKRCVESLNAVFSEVEQLVKSSWPSKVIREN